jgi:hypothetical protein
MFYFVTVRRPTFFRCIRTEGTEGEYEYIRQRGGSVLSPTGLSAATAKYTSNFYHQVDNDKTCMVISTPDRHTLKMIYRGTPLCMLNLRKMLGS